MRKIFFKSFNQTFYFRLQHHSKNFIFIFLLILWINSLFSKSEVGITTSFNFYLPNQSISSLKKTFYYNDQLLPPYRFFSSQEYITKNYEIYFFIYSLIENNDIFGIVMGSSFLPKIQSTYINDDEEIFTQWFGKFDFILFKYGKVIPYKIISKQNFLEIYGGIGFLFKIELFLKANEFSQNLFSEPFTFKKGIFKNSEGYLTRLGINFGSSFLQTKFRIGITFEYIIASLSEGKIYQESTKLFYYNKNKIWVSQDISYYLKNKDYYESSNLNIFYEYPKIESYSLTFGTINIFFSIGVNL